MCRRKGSNPWEKEIINSHEAKHLMRLYNPLLSDGVYLDENKNVPLKGKPVLHDFIKG